MGGPEGKGDLFICQFLDKIGPGIGARPGGAEHLRRQGRRNGGVSGGAGDASPGQGIEGGLVVLICRFFKDKAGPVGKFPHQSPRGLIHRFGGDKARHRIIPDEFAGKFPIAGGVEGGLGKFGHKLLKLRQAGERRGLRFRGGNKERQFPAAEVVLHRPVDVISADKGQEGLRRLELPAYIRRIGAVYKMIGKELHIVGGILTVPFRLLLDKIGEQGRLGPIQLGGAKAITGHVFLFPQQFPQGFSGRILPGCAGLGPGGHDIKAGTGPVTDRTGPRIHIGGFRPKGGFAKTDSKHTVDEGVHQVSPESGQVCPPRPRSPLEVEA